MQPVIGVASAKRLLGRSAGRPLRRKCSRIGGRARQAFRSRTISASLTFSNASRRSFLSFHQRAFWSQPNDSASATHDFSSRPRPLRRLPAQRTAAKLHRLRCRWSAAWLVRGKTSGDRSDYGSDHLNSTGESRMETSLKKPEIFRDSMGRFDRHGKTLAKTQKKSGLIKKRDFGENQVPRQPDGKYKHGGARPGAGRPKGSPNKVTRTLKEMILSSLEKLGGEDYLVALGRENSSAYTSILGKIVPHTLAAASESDGGSGVKLVFERHIVWPDGRREVEGVSPKSLPAPDDASNALPTDPTDDTNEGAV